MQPGLLLLEQRLKTIVGWRRLVVQTTGALPGLAGHAHALDEDTVRVLLSRAVAEGLRRGDPEARLVALHELGHVVLHAGAPADADGESGASALARAVSALVCDLG